MGRTHFGKGLFHWPANLARKFDGSPAEGRIRPKVEGRKSSISHMTFDLQLDCCRSYFFFLPFSFLSSFAGPTSILRVSARYLMLFSASLFKRLFGGALSATCWKSPIACSIFGFSPDAASTRALPLSASRLPGSAESTFS